MMAEEKIQRRPYGSPNVDGFPDGQEDPVAYCPREQKKKTPDEHQSCEHHREDLLTPEEGRDAALCAFEEPAASDPADREARKSKKKKKEE